jgi:hypothetical protein
MNWRLCSLQSAYGGPCDRFVTDSDCIVTDPNTPTMRYRFKRRLFSRWPCTGPHPWAGTQCASDPQTVYQTVSWPAILDEAPFLNTIFFLMVHRDLPPLALAQCLTRARFGYWSDDRRTFFTERKGDNHGQGLSIRWSRS